MRQHWIAINTYRSFTDGGFANTWKIYRCTREQQIGAQTIGLLAQNGRSASYTTHGVWTATAQEIAQAKREIERFGDSAIDWLDIERVY